MKVVKLQAAAARAHTLIVHIQTDTYSGLQTGTAVKTKTTHSDVHTHTDEAS